MHVTPLFFFHTRGGEREEGGASGGLYLRGQRAPPHISLQSCWFMRLCFHHGHFTDQYFILPRHMCVAFHACLSSTPTSPQKRRVDAEEGAGGWCSSFNNSRRLLQPNVSARWAEMLQLFNATFLWVNTTRSAPHLQNKKHKKQKSGNVFFFCLTWEKLC